MRVFRAMSHQSPPPVPPVKPTGRKLWGCWALGAMLTSRSSPPMAQGPLEISGILRDGEKENASPHFIFFFPLSKAWGENLSPNLGTHCHLVGDSKFSSLSDVSDNRERIGTALL